MALNLQQPPIPQPIADLRALTQVALAVKARLDTLSSYLETLSITSVAATTSASSYTLPVASQVTLGGVRLDGITVTVTPDGVISAVSTGPAAGVILPLSDGTAAVGTHPAYAREDHVHPTDASRYPASNPAGFVSGFAVDAAVAASAAHHTLLMLLVNGDIPPGLVCASGGQPVYVPVVL